MTFDLRWERIYGDGKQLNLYPYDAIVGFVFSRFGRVADRSAVCFLDVGCGAGNHTWFLAREGFTVCGIDGSRSAVEFARERLTNVGLEADLRTGDFTELPWPDETFDVAIDRMAITHNTRPDVERSLDEVRRVLKPRGMLFAQMYCTRHPDFALGIRDADGSCGEFQEGSYFGNIARTFFADGADIDALYASRFRLEHKEQVVLKNHLEEGRISDSWWTVLARKEDVGQ